MKPLAERLKEVLGFDEIDIHNQAMKIGYDSNHPTEHKAFEYGAKSEHARTAKVIDALVECAVAIDNGLDSANIRQVIMIIKEARAALEKALEESSK